MTGIFRSKGYYKPPFKERTSKAVRTLVRSMGMLSIPILPALLAEHVWNKCLYSLNIHLPQKAEGIFTAALIPTLGALYSILAGIVFATVWKEYKTIRMAVKRADLETFLLYRDESISPLVYSLIGVCSFALLAMFALLEYGNYATGCIAIFTVSYLLTLYLAVMMEMDNPCSGVWYIRGIKPEWLRVNAKEQLKMLRRTKTTHEEGEKVKPSTHKQRKLCKPSNHKNCRTPHRARFFICKRHILNKNDTLQRPL